jgi:hypothetical protein
MNADRPFVPSSSLLQCMIRNAEAAFEADRLQARLKTEAQAQEARDNRIARAEASSLAAKRRRDFWGY